MNQAQSTYIILLRAVNVSGKNILKMSEFQTALTAAGFDAVQTYIQSGNVILQSSASASTVKSTIESLLSETYGLSVVCFVKDAPYIEKVLDQISFTGEVAPNKLFITFLDRSPDSYLLDALKAVDHGEEQFQLLDDILYFYLPEGMAKAKMNNNYFERKLKLLATGRNLNTLRKVLELANNQ